MLFRLFKKRSLLLLVYCCVGFAAMGHAADFDDRRVRSGLKQFKSILAADRDLSRKQTIDGKLLALLVYSDNQRKAENLAEELASSRGGVKSGTIRKMPIVTRVVNISELSEYSEKRLAGVYLTQPLSSSQLESLVVFGIDKRVVVYSPFEGDVYHGVFAGMSIGAKVYPLINLDTMRASKLRIKSFFMRIAKTYES